MEFEMMPFYYKGLDYLAASDGHIYGLNRGEIHQRKNKDGYMECTLGDMKHRDSRIRVHRIIAQLFADNPDCKAEVHHKDFDRTNNDCSNLEWVTHGENIQHSVRAGNWSGKHGAEKNGRAKLTAEEVGRIRELYDNGSTIAKICKTFHKPYSTVFNVVHNKTWVLK